LLLLALSACHRDPQAALAQHEQELRDKMELVRQAAARNALDPADRALLEHATVFATVVWPNVTFVGIELRLQSGAIDRTSFTTKHIEATSIDKLAADVLNHVASATHVPTTRPATSP
jgi:hypothetical protein